MERKELLTKVSVGLFILLLALMMWQLRGMDPADQLKRTEGWSEEAREVFFKDLHQEYIILKAKPVLTLEEQERLVGYVTFLSRHERFSDSMYVEEPPTPKPPKRSFLKKSMQLPKK